MKYFIPIITSAVLLFASCNHLGGGKGDTTEKAQETQIELKSSNDVLSAKKSNDKPQLSASDNEDDTIYEGVHIYPQFEGGMDKLPEFLSKNLVYPESARLSMAQGVVYVQFVIEKDGSVSNIEIKEGFNQACEEEAIRVVGLFPKWTPGQLNGKVVRTRLALPPVFSLK